MESTFPQDTKLWIGPSVVQKASFSSPNRESQSGISIQESGGDQEITPDGLNRRGAKQQMEFLISTQHSGTCSVIKPRLIMY